MRDFKLIACLAGVAMLSSAPPSAWAAPQKVAARGASSAAAADYARDAITVVSNTRQSIPPSANCTVWANAEGLGVGPGQLDGFHGVGFSINLKPLPAESNQRPSTFTEAMADLKARFPTTPAWITDAIAKDQAKIETACAQEQVTPFLIRKLTKADKK